MIKDTQYRVLEREFGKSGSITMSSMKSGMTRKTGSKYLKRGKVPSESRPARYWRTREDPFVDVSEDIRLMLEDAPELEALTIFTDLQKKHPGKFDDGQLRSLERRVRQLRLTCDLGKTKIASIPQIHKPGELMELDWTCMNALSITIGGVPFKHLLCHVVLTYSNWEWAEICFSESFLSLKKGFQAGVRRLGAVPAVLQTDNSSTATHQISKGRRERAFNHDYASFLEHYGVSGRSINVNSPDENGDVESANGHLKRRINQYLLLRGSRDFADRGEYESFLEDVLIRGNANRASKLKEELAVMRELPPTLLPAFTEMEAAVSSFSTVRVKKVAYSVPSRLKGSRVRLRIHEEKIEVYSGSVLVETLPRKPGTGYSINYRHVIESLRRKPGAFANCRYKDQLFPTERFRLAHERLRSDFEDRRADKEYLEILSLAAGNGEGKVSGILRDLLIGNVRFTMDAVKRALRVPLVIPPVEIAKPSLSSYDELLSMARRAICLLIH